MELTCSLIGGPMRIVREDKKAVKVQRLQITSQRTKRFLKINGNSDIDIFREAKKLLLSRATHT